MTNSAAVAVVTGVGPGTGTAIASLSADTGWRCWPVVASGLLGAFGNFIEIDPQVLEISR